MKEISRMMLIPIIVLAIGTVIFDYSVNILLELSTIVAEVLFGRGQDVWVLHAHCRLMAMLPMLGSVAVHFVGQK